MNSIVIGFVILGIMTVGVLVFIVTNAGKEAERARQKREACGTTEAVAKSCRSGE